MTKSSCRAVAYRSILMVASVLGQIACGRSGETQASLPASIPARVNATDGAVFEEKRVCMELGLRRAAEDSKGLPQGTTPVSPIYCYSDQLKTCLYFGGFLVGKKLNLMSVDLLTNEVLAVTSPGQEPAVGLSWEDYQQKQKELRGTCVK